MKMGRLEDARSCFILMKQPFLDQRRELKRKILANDKKDIYNSIVEFIELYKEEAYRWAGETYLYLEEYDSARFYLESAIQSEDPTMLVPRFQADLALVYHKLKNYQQASTIIDRLITRSDTTLAGSPDYFTGWYYSGIGEVDSAFYWLEKAYQNHSAEMPWLKVNPVFKNLKDDDRYWDLYERTGHKAYDEYMASMKE